MVLSKIRKMDTQEAFFSVNKTKNWLIRFLFWQVLLSLEHIGNHRGNCSIFARFAHCTPGTLGFGSVPMFSLVICTSVRAGSSDTRNIASSQQSALVFWSWRMKLGRVVRHDKKKEK